MKRPLFNKLVSYLYDLHEWYLETPDRSLDRAYKAALTIKAIEDEHFGGQKISAASGKYNDSVMSFFQADLKKYLDTAKYGLAEFKASRSLLKITEIEIKPRENHEVDGENLKSSQALESRENQAIIIEKLKFVGEIVDKYVSLTDINVSSSLITIPKSNVVRVDSQPIEPNVALVTPSAATTNSPVKGSILEPNMISEKSGVLPRSIGRTFERIQQELDPKAEAEVIKSFRKSKAKTVISIRFLLILIVVPILTQQISKTFVIGPIVERFRNPEKTEVFLNLDMEEEALRDLQKFEEILKFRNLVGLAPVISKEKMEEEVKHKATEIEEEYRHKSANAIKNVFADMISLMAFCFILVTRKREIQVLKSFMDEFVYGLSDSAKAFIIILFTDIFVGFHSPHGWEVLLESVARHLGLPENRGFIFLFIATFPVILDTIFKYWIFRYLSRMSPSAVATFRNMNE